MISNGPFYTTAGDNGLTIILKTEANIVLASVPKDTPKYTKLFNRFKDTISVSQAIGYTEPQTGGDINFIINTLNTINTTGILSPLTLQDDEFCKVSDNYGKYKNTRYPAIYCIYDGTMYNDNAFTCIVRATYNHDEGSEITHKYNKLGGRRMLYISKGGVLTGEYIDYCIIRKDVIDKHCFDISSPVEIPVCRIISEHLTLLAVDHREPKLKILRERYEVPVNIDCRVKELKYDIRKYKKLEK